MSEFLSPKGKQILVGKLGVLDTKARELKLDHGEAVGSQDGDTFHGETAALMEREKLNAQRMAEDLRKIIDGSKLHRLFFKSEN